MQHGLKILLLLVLSNCSAPLPLKPSSLGKNLSVQQHLILQQNSHAIELDAVLEIQDNELTLIILALGQRILTLHDDGQTLKIERHPALPKRIKAEDILRDIQLTLWPLQELKKNLAKNWSITENNQQRIINKNNNTIIRITYAENGTILENLRDNYTLTIQSLSLGK